MRPMPGAVGAGEKPKPGRSGETTWKAGWSAGGLVSGWISFSTSAKEPGQPWM